MHFQAKLGLYAANTLLPDRIGPLQMLEELQVPQSSARFLRNYLFEPAVSLASTAPTLNARVLIGAHSYMNDGGYFRGQLTIGRYCSIGRRVTLGAGAHEVSGLTSSPRLRAKPMEAVYSAEEIAQLGLRATPAARPLHIGHDVWIGDGAVVLPGIEIGTGAVIGANAMVNRDVPPYAIVGGLPARVIRYRFPPEIVADLLDSAWWEIPHTHLQSIDVSHVPRSLPLLRAAEKSANYPTCQLA